MVLLIRITEIFAIFPLCATLVSFEVEDFSYLYCGYYYESFYLCDLKQCFSPKYSTCLIITRLCVTIVASNYL